jgi:hypothetical protein
MGQLLHALEATAGMGAAQGWRVLLASINAKANGAKTAWREEPPTTSARQGNGVAMLGEKARPQTQESRRIALSGRRLRARDENGKRDEKRHGAGNDQTAQGDPLRTTRSVRGFRVGVTSNNPDAGDKVHKASLAKL